MNVCNFTNIAFLFELIVKVLWCLLPRLVCWILENLILPHLGNSHANTGSPSIQLSHQPKLQWHTLRCHPWWFVYWLPPIFVRFYAAKILNLDFAVRQVKASQTLEGWWSNSRHQEDYQPHLARGGDVFVDVAWFSAGICWRVFWAFVIPDCKFQVWSEASNLSLRPFSKTYEVKVCIVAWWKSYEHWCWISPLRLKIITITSCG